MIESNNPASAKNTPLDMEKWRTIISEWEPNKENQKQYCERLGINLNTFTYARSKLKQPKKMKSTFIPITLSPSENQQLSATDIMIENSQGFKLHISSGLSLERLTKIFKLCGW